MQKFPRRCGLMVALAWTATAAVCVGAIQPMRYTLRFATYLGGNGEDQGRGICADSRGNIYVVGGTESANFPIHDGMSVNTQTPTDPFCGFGNMDVFLTKFNSSGQLVWSTALGGPNYERAYEVKVGPGGNVYVGGRAGIGFPVTSNAFQRTFLNVQTSGVKEYGSSDGCIAKFTPDGALLWASYIGASINLRCFDVDTNGDIYAGIYFVPGQMIAPAWFSWAFTNAYQKTCNPNGDGGVAKISGDGTTVLWATWLGGTNGSGVLGSVRVDAGGNVYAFGNTTSASLPTTPGAAQGSYRDLYVAKLSADGSSLLAATYFGGNGSEFNNTHNLAVDKNGNAYIATQTTSTDLPTTIGAYQRTPRNGRAGAVQVAKFSPTLGLLACTYVSGASGVDNVEDIRLDDQGNVFLAASTTATDFPVTASAYQPTKGAGMDAAFVKLSSDLTQLLYSTFIGGGGNEMNRACWVDGGGNYYLYGQTDGVGWPLVNAYQSTFGGAPNDTVIAVFAPSGQPPMITNGPTGTPNPASLGQNVAFTVGATDPNGFPISYAWDFGDSGNSTNLAPNHSYTAGGTFLVTVAVSNDQGGLATASLVIIVTGPPAPGTLQFTSANYVVDKSDRFAQASVSRLAGGSGAMRVDCRTFNGSAQAGQDYVPVAVSLAWADGETGDKTVRIPIIDDDLLVEDTKNAFLILQNPTGSASLGSPSNAVLQITARNKLNNGLIAHWAFDETNGTLAADSTGNGHNGTVVGASWTIGKLNGALRFNGANSSVTVPDSPALSPASALTVALWVKPALLNDGVLASKWIDGSKETWLFRARSDGLRLNLASSLNDSSYSGATTVPSVLTVGVWQHVAFVYDGTQPTNPAKLRIYVNGILRTLTFFGNLPAVLTAGSAPVTFGLGAAAIRPFNGILDDVRFYSRALPPQVIQALAAGNDDTDGDGLPDAWEYQHFGNLTTANATTDTDGDGVSDLAEYLAGTDPNSPASFFHILSITPQGNDRLITWQAGPGFTNIVQATPSFSVSFTNISPNILMIGSVTNYLDVGAAANFPARFYRVKVLP